MSDNPSYRFDPAETSGSTYFLIDGDQVAFLEQPLIPPVGTQVSLPGGIESEVQSVRLDLSNDSNLAMIYVEVKKPRTGKVWGV